MAFYDKTYTQYKHENFDTFLKSVGMPEDKIQAYLSSTTKVTVKKNGDSYSIIQTFPEGVKETTFKSGVEFNDNIGGRDSTTTFTVDGNTITQVLKTSLGTATFKREFNGDELIVTITAESFDGVARRYYKA